MSKEYPHTWAMSWPGNYCKECGQDAPTESAICCPDCIFDYPGPNDDWATYAPKPPALCAEHQAWTDRPCPYKMVVHCMHADYDVYCGRGKCPKTKKVGEWGNPFSIGPDGDRKEVIQKFIELVTPQPELIARIKRELKGKVLGCWCAPKRCHCHFLAAVANS